MKYLLLSLTCLLLLVSCGGSESSKPDITIPETKPALPQLGEALFPETERWGNDIAYRTIESQDKNLVDKVIYSEQGTSCFINRQTSIGSQKLKTEWPSTVECLNIKGEQVITHQAQGTGIIKDLLFKSDGSLVIAELIDFERDADHLKTFYLQLIHYSATGILLKKQILIDAPNQDELYYYSVNNGEINRKIIDDLVDGDKPTLPSTSLVKLVLHQDDIYILAYTYGIKVYQLTDDLLVNWDVQVMPAYTYLWTHMLQSQADMTISAEGQVYVAFDLWAEDTQAYNIHFDRSINIAAGQGGIAIEMFSSTGEYQRSLLLDNVEQTENITAIIHHNQSLWLGSNVRRSKEQTAGGTTEWDILLAKLSPESGDTLGYHYIHHDQEDIAYDFKLLPNDNFIFSGSTGFVQVDTNSKVSYGDGFLLEVTPEGQIIGSAVLSKPRDVAISSIAVLESNLIMFSGSFDGPITHTCDTDTSLCYQSGMVGIARITPHPL